MRTRSAINLQSGQNAATFEGSISGAQGSGVWADIFQCNGTWEANLTPCHAIAPLRTKVHHGLCKHMQENTFLRNALHYASGKVNESYREPEYREERIRHCEAICTSTSQF